MHYYVGIKLIFLNLLNLRAIIEYFRPSTFKP
jgi:hypothetical protein